MLQNDEFKIATLPDGFLTQLPEAVQKFVTFQQFVIQQQEARIQEQQNTIQEQQSTIQQQEGRIQQLEIKIHELEARLSKNSSNSSKPPSSDGLKKSPKTTSPRGKSGKRPGGQKGRKGTTLNQVANPDHVVTHSPKSCHGCGHDLTKVEGADSEKRQVFEIPQPEIEVTEHRAEIKQCPCCGGISKGLFPDHVSAPVQYGERVQALVAYFSNQHLLPVDRLCQIFEDVFDISLSPGTCSNLDKKLFKKLESFETNLKTYLVVAAVLHFDETGIRCNKKLHWIHVASSESATFFGIHAKRGQEATDEFDILPQFRGTAVHDHWFPYFTYDQALHGLCNTHHLRELTYVHEQEKEGWAERMKSLLIKAKKIVEKHREENFLPSNEKLAIEKEYGEILEEGFEYHKKLIPLPKSKRGRQKQRVGKNLLDRLKGKQECVLRFIYDFNVPFTNNLGEQDIRMVKVKEKISGCFRSIQGGQIFCRIRSYISTARKQQWKILDALIDAVKGNPRLLSLHT